MDPRVIYQRNHPNKSWYARGREPFMVADESLYKPARYSSVDEARISLGAPLDAQYIVWNPAWGDIMLEQVFMQYVTNNNAILVLPERYNADGSPKPYLIDSSAGFRALNVYQVDANPEGTEHYPIQNMYRGLPTRTWFSMARGRRGIIGLGPDVIIQPSVSSFSQGPQPYPQKVYFTNGTTQQLVGAQNTLIEFEHAFPFLGNITFRGRDFGGVAYSCTRAQNLVRVWMDKSWRGFSGIPNGETGGVTISGAGDGIYRIEHCTFDPGFLAPSPIMWNRTLGGTMKHVKVGKPNHGMLTYWRCMGVNIWEDVHATMNGQIVNLEEGGPGFELHWKGGYGSTDGNWHIIGESHEGSKLITFTDVELVGGTVAGALNAHFYSYDGQKVQKKSDIQWNLGPENVVGFVV